MQFEIQLKILKSEIQIKVLNLNYASEQITELELLLKTQFISASLHQQV